MRTNFDVEILNAYDEAVRTIDKRCRSRLDRALMIALTKTILDRGGWYEVQSQVTFDRTYRVTEHDCTCMDVRAPIITGRKTCKHRLAVSLVIQAREAVRIFDELPPPVEATTRHWDRWEP